jgi:hypothetical protein
MDVEIGGAGTAAIAALRKQARGRVPTLAAGRDPRVAATVAQSAGVAV